MAEIGQDQRLDRRVVLAAATVHCRASDEFQMRHRDAVVLRSVDQEQGTAIACRGGRGTGIVD